MKAPKPIVVSGMHRSGTSWLTSFLSASGVNVGERLVAANPTNPLGFFEDTDFLEINRDLLMRATPEEEGHRDWGWTVSEKLDPRCFEEYRTAAKALISNREGTPGIWGWKDPRTTLTLEFWHALLMESGCDPLYILLYRFPWDVADSMQRLGADVFLRHPEYALRIWTFYNRHLLKFFQEHRGHCLLLSSDALRQHPERWRSLLANRLGSEVPLAPESLRDDTLWHAQAGTDPMIALMASTAPECLQLLSEMDTCADLPGADLWNGSRELRLKRPAFGSGGALDLSVVVPCYNHGEFLIEAIASAERFLPGGCELVVVNDGSDQARTLEVLQAVRNLGYQVLDLPRSGLAEARNRGIALARGRYVLPLDADNRLRGGFAETAIQFLDTHPEVGVVYGDRWNFGKHRGYMRVADFDPDSLLLENYIDACAVYRRALWSSCGGYDPGLSAWEDWEFWIAASERGWQFHRVDMVAFDYRVRPESLVRSTLIPEVGAQLHARILRRHSALFLQRTPEILAGMIGNPPVSVVLSHIRRLIAGCEVLLRDKEANTKSWVERAHAAEHELRDLHTRVQATEAGRAHWIQRSSEMEQQVNEVLERLASAQQLLGYREHELAAIRSSATWLWSRKLLQSWPARWLLPALLRITTKRKRKR